jgi:hypothetical protein
MRLRLRAFVPHDIVIVVTAWRPATFCLRKGWYTLAYAALSPDAMRAESSLKGK